MTHSPEETERPLLHPKKIRVVCVGAGFSGLTLAHSLQNVLKATTEHEGGYIDFTIYEKNAGVGGTWYENTYPGVACDVAAHVYVFEFENNPDWSKYFAGGQEILEYIRRTTEKYELDRHIMFNSKLVESIWDGQRGVWNLKVESAAGDIIEDCCHVLVNAAGILNKWKWPSIKGLNDFKGDLFHSARWDHSKSLEGKSVLLIGNGSSAIQILPQIAKQARHVYNTIRNPTWITPMANGFLTGGENFEYTEEQRREFKEHPEKLAELQQSIKDDLNAFTFCMMQNGPGQKTEQESYVKIMRERLQNKEHMLEGLIPAYKAGCRRLTPGTGYLETLLLPHVEIMQSSIERITEDGVILNVTRDISNGVKIGDHPVRREIKVDAIICATGFDVSFQPYWKMVGSDAIDLAQQWKTTPKAYLSVAVPNMPNYFIFNGPHCPISHGSVMEAINAESHYITQWIQKIAAERIKRVTPRQQIVDQAYRFYQSELKRSVYAEDCNSWYKPSPSSEITALYPGTMKHFAVMLQTIRGEHFDVEYDDPENWFAFYGSGRSLEEARKPNAYMNDSN